jgi:hypothetical protein
MTESDPHEVDQAKDHQEQDLEKNPAQDKSAKISYEYYSESSSESSPESSSESSSASSSESSPAYSSESSSESSSAYSSESSSAYSSESSSDLFSSPPGDLSTGPSANHTAEVALEPDKRLAEAEPDELIQALRSVFNGNDEKSQTQLTSRDVARSSPAYTVQQQGRPESQVKEVEAKSGYTNPFALFADVFYGVLIAPRQTLSILSDSSRFPPTFANLLLTFVLVFGVLALPAAIKVGANGGSEMGVLKASGFIVGNLFNWAMLSFILYYLSIWLRGNKLSLGNAFIATGWAYLPFVFFAPVACFKSALGNGFTLFACVPALWFLVLEWFAFQTSLRTSAIKLALIALVVPPIFCLVYLFWIGLAAFSLISQLLSHLT